MAFLRAFAASEASACTLLTMALLVALLLTPCVSVSLPEDPLDASAFEAVRSAGHNFCAFDNGTRLPSSSLPKGYFGPEPCVFESGMVLRANDPLGGKGAAAGALVWGFSKPGAKVACALDTDAPVAATADSSGLWELTLQQKGSPDAHTLVFSTPGSPSVSLTNVLFGGESTSQPSQPLNLSNVRLTHALAALDTMASRIAHSECL